MTSGDVIRVQYDVIECDDLDFREKPKPNNCYKCRIFLQNINPFTLLPNYNFRKL